LKIATPDRSDVPIFEPGLHPLMVRNIAAGRLPSTNLLRYRAFGGPELVLSGFWALHVC
jgi:hypothetical protein